MELVLTATNVATEEPDHHRYKLDIAKITVPDYHALQGGQHPQRSLELAPKLTQTEKVSILAQNPQHLRIMQVWNLHANMVEGS